MDLAQIKELITKQGTVASHFLKKVLNEQQQVLNPHTQKLDDQADSHSTLPLGAKSPVLKVQERKDGTSVLVEMQDDGANSSPIQNPNRIKLLTEYQTPTGTTRSRIQIYEELLAGREANRATRNTTKTGKLVSPLKVLLPITSAVKSYLGVIPNPAAPLTNTVTRLMSMSMDYASSVAPAALPKPQVIDTNSKPSSESTNPITSFIANAQKTFDDFISSGFKLFSPSPINIASNPAPTKGLEHGAITYIDSPILTSQPKTNTKPNTAQNIAQTPQERRNQEIIEDINSYYQTKYNLEERKEEKIWEDKRIAQEQAHQKALKEQKKEAKELLSSTQGSEKEKQAKFSSYIDKLARYSGLDPHSFTSKRELLVAILNSGKPVDTLMSVFN